MTISNFAEPTNYREMIEMIVFIGQDELEAFRFMARHANDGEITCTNADGSYIITVTEGDDRDAD